MSSKYFVAESLQFRKLILKGNGNSSTAQENMTIATMQSNDRNSEVINCIYSMFIFDCLHLLQKINSLLKLKASTEKTTKVNSQKHEWICEYNQLEKSANVSTI